MYRAPRKLAVTDFAPTRRAHAARLADGVGREIVVEQEPLLVGSRKRIDVLLVLAGAKRCDHERLRFAAGEQRRAVRAREDADLREDWTYGSQVASIDPALRTDNPLLG